MRPVRLDSDAVSDLDWWSGHDPDGAERVAALIRFTQKNPFEGFGDPERLPPPLNGLWSRRINDEHFLVYEVSKTGIRILACRTER
ncbi:MAG: Txe/YoeB family addiction module toxin [Bacteroidota bacterium]